MKHTLQPAEFREGLVLPIIGRSAVLSDIQEAMNEHQKDALIDSNLAPIPDQES